MVELKMRSKFMLHPKQLMGAVQEASFSPQEKCAELVKLEAKRLLSVGGGKGRAVGKGKPSQPGEPPRLQSGNLRLSIKWERWKNGYIIGPTVAAPYGKYLERGTRKMAARPFMRPALLNMKSRFIQKFRNANLNRTRFGRWLNLRDIRKR